MKIMKCILISFIIVNLALQGFLRSVSAANVGLKPPKSTEFALKVKPLTMNEQVFLKTIETKKHSLLNQAAGSYYNETNGKPHSGNNALLFPNPNAKEIIDAAMLGAFIGWLASSGKDFPSVRKSTQIGALLGTVAISVFYMF